MSPSSSAQPKPLSERKAQAGSELAILRQWTISKAHANYHGRASNTILELAKAMERQILGEEPWPKLGEEDKAGEEG